MLFEMLNSETSLLRMKFQIRKAKKCLSALSCGLLFIVLVANCPAQGTKEAGEAVISPEARAEVINAVTKMLIEKYVFLETAEKIERQLRENLKNSKYDKLTDALSFAEALEKDLREISQDRHVSFFHDPKMFETLQRGDDESSRAAREAASRADEKHINYGFKKVERLDANIGYIELVRFSAFAADEGGAVATGAMSFVANSDALIIDLRKNPGGSGKMGQLLGSYFFAPGDDKWLVSNNNRSRGTTRQEWTFAYVPGKRMPDVDLYILIGPNTGSAAEGFAYNLQALKRATIVGERSAGAAHSGEMAAIAKGFVMFVPAGRTVNPITNANWEGVGVKPDVEVKSRNALLKAQALALEKIKNKYGDERRKTHAEWLLKSLNAALAPIVVEKSLLESYAGKYEGQITVTLENGELFFQSKADKKLRLVALDKDTFTVEGADYYGVGRQRMQFVKNEKGQVIKAATLVNHDAGKIAVFEDKRID